MSDDEKILLCMRVADNAIIYPGSAIVRCDRCPHDVWVSPASQLMLAEGAIARCMEHYGADADVQVDRRSLAEAADWFANPDRAPKITPR